MASPTSTWPSERRRGGALPAFPLLLLLLLAALPLASSGPARAHGASRGLHLHLSPDPALPGAKVRLRVDASSPMLRLRAGWAGQEAVETRPRKARKKIVLRLRVPEVVEGESLSLAAEAETVSGEVLRAAAILRVKRPE